MAVSSPPTPAARLYANILSTGHAGGRDLHLRTLRELGVTLAGHFLGASDAVSVRGQGSERIDLHGFGAVLFAAGFRPDYDSWLTWPGAFDELGFPLHEDGESTAIPGIYFVGVHFLRKRKSSLLVGVGEDAAIVARRVAARLSRARARPR